MEKTNLGYYTHTKTNGLNDAGKWAWKTSSPTADTSIINYFANSQIGKYYESALISECPRTVYWEQGDIRTFVCLKDADHLEAISAVFEKDEITNKFDDTARVIAKYVVPTWFCSENYLKDREQYLHSEKPWFCGNVDESWTEPKMDRKLLALIVDKLLSAKLLNENSNSNASAHVILKCSSENLDTTLDTSDEIMRYALRCLPVKIANKISYNTVASEEAIGQFDICCYRSDSDQKIEDGLWVNVDKVVQGSELSEYVVDGETLKNTYAMYIEDCEGDPCVGLENYDDIDKLNDDVLPEVYKQKCSNIITPKAVLKEDPKELKEVLTWLFKKKGEIKIDNSVSALLEKVAIAIQTDYDLFTKGYFQLDDGCKKFYDSYVDGKTESFNPQSFDFDTKFTGGESDKAFIAKLYSFQDSKQEVKDKLFKNYKERFRDHDNLKNAFYKYWAELDDNAFAKFLKEGKMIGTVAENAGNLECVIQYVATVRCSDYKQLIKCCETLKDYGAKDATLKAICDKYIDKLQSDKDKVNSENKSIAPLSFDEWVDLEEEITSLKVTLDGTQKNYVDDKKRSAGKNEYDSVKSYLQRESGSKIDKLKPTKSTQRIIVRLKNLFKDKDKKIDTSDKGLYNLERLKERDYGKTGAKNNTNVSVHLKIITFVTLIFYIVWFGLMWWADSMWTNIWSLYNGVAYVEKILTCLLPVMFFFCQFVHEFRKSQDRAFIRIESCDGTQFGSAFSSMFWIWSVWFVVIVFLKIVVALIGWLI